MVEKCSEFIDTFSEGIQEQLNYSYRAENGLQQLLDSINYNLDGSNADTEIEDVKTELREVLSKAQDYRNACLQAARRGSQKQEINGINRAIKEGDLQSLFQLVNDMLHLFTKCSECLESLENKCKNTRQKLRSAAARYEADKKSAEDGKKDSTIATAAGAGVAVLGAILTPIFPPAGLVVVGAGLATAAGGGIGVAVHSDRLNTAQKSLCKLELLSDDLESVKRRVYDINTTMEECKDKVRSSSRSGERAKRKKRVSQSVCFKIKKSLDSMCTKFEELIQRRL